MGECNIERKRVRDDSEENSPESKFLRVDSVSSDTNSSESHLTPGNSVESRELGRVDSDDSVLNSPVVNEFQDDFLNMFDETVNVTEGLDFVIKSFEEEILTPGSGFEPFSAEFKPNLVYLLEASDDELGLPPTVTDERQVEINEPGSVGPERFDSTGFLGLEDDLRSLSDEAFGFENGVLCDGYYGENGGSYVIVDGLFDYSETTEILWRCESLQAM
ncbi:hypothetical protein TanjilG_18686 [Lupinus angustifolius]|uniref:Uncharacterized protein n=1 Tax=Lupinus angustifolius TaxID=3871 RepID=A0A1J7FZK7_LUPAN|nr:PREDICTED: uncharacterized protein LOC109332305 [Lupinus angustifolius]OIV93470.1 hypothetical protein TanjilG_18686 [Lupinus angustifolius]